jgi:hypothetical protein
MITSFRKIAQRYEQFKRGARDSQKDFKGFDDDFKSNSLVQRW